MSDNPQGSGANAAIVLWSMVLTGCGVAIIVAQLSVEYVLRFKQLSSEPALFPVGLVVLIVGAILLAYATYRSTMQPDAGRKKLDPAKIIIASGVAIIALQIALEYALRFTHLSRESSNVSIGLVVLAVGAILLAFTTYNARHRAAPKPDASEAESDPE
jgi:uncharacterized membrane protein YidH (DUF202 family)